MTTWKNIARYLGYALSLAALAYMVYRLAIYDDYAALLRSFQSASTVQYLFLVAAIVLLPLQLLVESRKWQLMLQGLTSISFRAAWQQVLRGYVGAFITPYRLGEYPTRLWQIGYTMDEWKNAIGGWKEWLLNWKKWIRVACWHLMRYIVWMAQWWLILLFLQVDISPVQAITAIAEYYVIITIAPYIPSAEVACKGGWATLIFSQYTSNIPAIALAVVFIWFINTIFPTIMGTFTPFRQKK